MQNLTHSHWNEMDFVKQERRQILIIDLTLHIYQVNNESSLLSRLHRTEGHR